MQSRQCCQRERDLWKERVFPHCHRCWVVQGLSQQPLTTSSAVVPVQQEQLLAHRASTVGLVCKDLTSCGLFPYWCATGLVYGVREYSSTQHVAPFSPSVRRFCFLPPAKLGEKGLGTPKHQSQGHEPQHHVWHCSQLAVRQHVGWCFCAGNSCHLWTFDSVIFGKH